MERFFQYIFDGLSVGAIYALLALGLVVVFRGTGHLNFAQGEMAMFCTFLVWQVHDWGLPLWLAVIVGMILGFVLGAATEVVLIRPVAKRSVGAVFVISIALFLGLNSLASMIWGALPNEAMPNLFPAAPDDFVRISGAVWRYKSIGVLVVALVLCGLLFLLFRKTKFGLAMRAVANNADSARLVGIRTGNVLMASWGIAAAMGALSGALVAGNNGEVNSSLMFTVFIYASAAATLGGLDSPGGAVVAGLSIGVLENMAAGYAPAWIGQEMRLGVALLTIFVVLLLRPSGLFGSTRVERV
ncbi:MAG: branched-chain amino acid ABC transporter permease [Acidimicrobiia bacterium]